MTEENNTLTQLLQKSGDSDFLRRVAEAVLQILMEADVEGVIGAGRHERSAERLNRQRLLRSPARHPAGLAPAQDPEAAPVFGARESLYVGVRGNEARSDVTLMLAHDPDTICSVFEIMLRPRPPRSSHLARPSPATEFARLARNRRENIYSARLIIIQGNPCPPRRPRSIWTGPGQSPVVIT